MIGEAAAQRRLPRRILAFAGGDDIAHDAFVDNLRIDDCDPGSAVLDDISKIGGLQQRVYGNGDRARGDRAPESDREPSRVGDNECDALIMASTCVAEDSGETSYGVIELAIRDRSFTVDDRQSCRLPFTRVAADEPGCRVETKRKVIGRTEIRCHETYMMRCL